MRIECEWKRRNILPHTDFVMKIFEPSNSANMLGNVVGKFVKKEVLLISYLS
jgi:hypothetical protein